MYLSQAVPRSSCTHRKLSGIVKAVTRLPSIGSAKGW